MLAIASFIIHNPRHLRGGVFNQRERPFRLRREIMRIWRFAIRKRARSVTTAVVIPRRIGEHWQTFEE
jgi:hypothetical protein